MAASAYDKNPEPTAANACNPPQVWYKHDLRVDDHPGLVQAAVDGSMVAAVVLDPSMYSHLLATPCGVEGGIFPLAHPTYLHMQTCRRPSRALVPQRTCTSAYLHTV